MLKEPLILILLVCPHWQTSTNQNVWCKYADLSATLQERVGDCLCNSCVYCGMYSALPFPSRWRDRDSCPSVTVEIKEKLTLKEIDFFFLRVLDSHDTDAYV